VLDQKKFDLLNEKDTVLDSLQAVKIFINLIINSNNHKIYYVKNLYVKDVNVNVLPKNNE